MSETFICKWGSRKIAKTHNSKLLAVLLSSLQQLLPVFQCLEFTGHERYKKFTLKKWNHCNLLKIIIKKNKCHLKFNFRTLTLLLLDSKAPPTSLYTRAPTFRETRLTKSFIFFTQIKTKVLPNCFFSTALSTLCKRWCQLFRRNCGTGKIEMDFK